MTKNHFLLTLYGLLLMSLTACNHDEPKEPTIDFNLTANREVVNAKVGQTLTVSYGASETANIICSEQVNGIGYRLESSNNKVLKVVSDQQVEAIASGEATLTIVGVEPKVDDKHAKRVTIQVNVVETFDYDETRIVGGKKSYQNIEREMGVYIPFDFTNMSEEVDAFKKALVDLRGWEFLPSLLDSNIARFKAVKDSDNKFPEDRLFFDISYEFANNRIYVRGIPEAAPPATFDQWAEPYADLFDCELEEKTNYSFYYRFKNPKFSNLTLEMTLRPIVEGSKFVSIVFIIYERSMYPDRER